MPDLSVVLPFLIGVVIVLIALMILVALVRAFYVKVEQGTALIVNDLSARPKVRFTGALVVPVLYKAEIMRISLITLQVDRRGKEGLICKDNIRADITVAYYLRVNETTEDVLKVAKSIGASRASDLNAVDEAGAIAEIEPDSTSGAAPMEHAGEELLYVLSGSLEFEVAEERFTLRRGDALHFRTDRPHRWRSAGDRPARVVWLALRQP